MTSPLDRIRNATDAALAPIAPESVVIDQAREKLKRRYPGAPVELAINYALGNTTNITREMVGPLAPIIRRAVLINQLNRSDRYLRPLIKFWQLGGEKDIDTEGPR